MHDRLPRTDELPLTALRYAAGELSPIETAAFEARLADDQEAREALAESIRLSAAALDRPTPAPDPLIREVVRDALRPTVFSWLFPRRPYRGHPIAWASLGGVVAAGLTALGVWLGDLSDNEVAPTTVEVTAPTAPNASLPVNQLTVKPVEPDEALADAVPPPRDTADPPVRTVTTDAEEKPIRLLPERTIEGKATLQPEPGSR